MIGFLRNFIVVVKQSMNDFKYNYKHVKAHSKENNEIHYCPRKTVNNSLKAQ